MEAPAAEAAPRPHCPVAPGEFGPILAHVGRELIGALETLKSRVGSLPNEAGPGDAADCREQIATMEILCEGLVTLTGDSLDLAALAEGGLEPRVGTIDLAAVAAELDDRFAREAARRGLAWSCTFEESRSTATRADADWCRQILGRLVVNALQATPEGRSVRVTLGCDGRGWSALIADTGPGLPDGFDRGNVPPRAYAVGQEGLHTGNGLGLALCRSLVDRMGGRIEFDSSPGEGTRVSVFVPPTGGDG